MIRSRKTQSVYLERGVVQRPQVRVVNDEPSPNSVVKLGFIFVGIQGETNSFSEVQLIHINCTYNKLTGNKLQNVHLDQTFGIYTTIKPPLQSRFGLASNCTTQ